jgi:hypothetical protein
MTEQGAHYKTAPGEQHYQRAMRLKLHWLAGNITKYAERAPHKGQETEDVVKILDYTCMWVERLDLSKEQTLRVATIIDRMLNNVGAEARVSTYENTKKPG